MVTTYKKYFGFYRARVVDSAPETYSDYGAVIVAVPDFMVELLGKNESLNSLKLNQDGLLAFPANNPIGGRNAESIDNSSNNPCYYQGSVYTPPVNSYVWIFFEGGDIDRPYFFSAFDSMCSKLPPEQTSVENPDKVYTIIKTHSGRTICVSDDTNTQRVEMTGRKRLLSGSDPAGNSSSTYTIDGNMNTILIDERPGKDKILIKTYKGDFINIDVIARKLNMYFANDIVITSGGKVSINASKDIILNSGKNIYFSAEKSINTKAKKGSSNLSCGGGININCTAYVRLDGARTLIQSGPAKKAGTTDPLTPRGDRNG